MIDDSILAPKVVELLEHFHQRRRVKLDEIRLKKLLDKNPYLYRSIGIVVASEFVRAALDAFISSSDETIFGNVFFEPLAKWAATEAHRDSPDTTVQSGGGAGFDVSIESASEYRAIAVKSGTNIFNAQSGKQQNTEWDALHARIRKEKKVFHPIIGYGYGRKRQRDPDPKVVKLAGQAFWEEITGEADFYLRISQSMGSRPAELANDFEQAWAQTRNRLEKSFHDGFVDAKGDIDWDRVIAANSAHAAPQTPGKRKKPV